jgi:hypothetical protein
LRSATSSTSASTSTPHRRTYARGTSSASTACARRRSRTPASYFSRYARLDDEAATTEAERLWDTVNGPNLKANIEPTRSRATLVLRKEADHRVRWVRLRKL